MAKVTRIVEPPLTAWQSTLVSAGGSGLARIILPELKLRAHALVLVALSTCVQLLGSAAAAAATRVVLIDPGPELERAARAALEPWHVEIAVVSAPSPGSSAPTAHERAQLIARTESAATVVWVSEHEAGHALWIYDAATRHAVARPLTVEPPFDPPGAAAVALSLKTLLRHSESAPVEERYGARASAARPAESAQPAPRPRDGAAPRRTRPRTHAGPSRVEPDVALGGRFRLVKGGSEEFRVGLAATYWPGGSWGGLSLRSAFGPSLEVDDQRFQGLLSSITLGLGARARWEPVRWLRGSAGVSAAADVMRLSGVALADGQRAAPVRRVVPALALELGLDWLALPWLRVGLRGAPTWLVRTQRYRLRGEPVLELSRVCVEAALVLGFGHHDP